MRTKLGETNATLRFFGDDLDPDVVTQALGVKPTIGVLKGGIWYTSLGWPKIAPSGSWRLETERRRPGDLDGQIVELLFPLTQDLFVWRALTARFEADIFIGLHLTEFHEEIGLKPETALMVGQRGLSLNFDIYSGEDDTEEAED